MKEVLIFRAEILIRYFGAHQGPRVIFALLNGNAVYPIRILFRCMIGNHWNVRRLNAVIIS